jgi:hypothetical protein
LRDNKYIRGLANRKFVADAISMAIFWTIVYTPVFLYTSKSLEAALVGLGSASVLEILFGGVYGRFNDWFRGKMGVSR